MKVFQRAAHQKVRLLKIDDILIFEHFFSGHLAENLSGTSSCTCISIFATVALSVLLFIILIAFSVLLLVHVRHRKTLSSSDRNEKNLYEMPLSKVDSKLEGDVIPRKMKQSSAYETQSLYNLIFMRIAKDSVDEETYAEIAVDAPKKEDTDP